METIPMIKFTQYLRPDGRQVPVYIERSDEIARKAEDLTLAGYTFCVEMLMDGTVHFTVSDDTRDYIHELSQNSPEVLEAVDRLVTRAHNRLIVKKEFTNG